MLLLLGRAVKYFHGIPEKNHRNYPEPVAFPGVPNCTDTLPAVQAIVYLPF
jgi:hypothetical protein